MSRKKICLIFLSIHLLLTLSGLSATFGPVVLIVGTRPEAIKMVPLYWALQNKNIPTVLCSTGQHAQMLDDMLTLFKIEPDYDLKIMRKGQDLFYITEAVLEKIKVLFQEIHPSMVVVQGDTTSAMAAALAAFYLKIPVAHVEAGLRTGNIHAPFPEEMNRKMISVIAQYHFAPTQCAVSNLLSEGVSNESIFCTGNTVVDALYAVKNRFQQNQIIPSPEVADVIMKQRALGKKIILLTTHRRESLSGGLQHIFQAIIQSTKRHPELYIVYPMHPNPLIREAAQAAGLYDLENIFITNPVSYHDLVYVLDAVDGVATDSGGIQEEAVSLNKPMLILRNETDRPEGLQAGYVELVGTDQEKIIAGIDRIVLSETEHLPFTGSVYGDGHASEKMAHLIGQFIRDELND